MSKLLYDVVNPSDAITFAAPDREIAALATILLSNGQFGADPIGHNAGDVPIFLFGGARDWCVSTFGRTIEEAVAARGAELAACLDSHLYGSVEDRARFEHEQEDLDTDREKAAHRATWQSIHRSSSRDICAAAAEMAENVRVKFT